MPLMNWPPSRGPKPPEIDVVGKSFEMPEPGRREFRFRQPKDAVEEQKVLVAAALSVKYKELGGKEQRDAKLLRDLRGADGEPRCAYERTLDLDVHVATLATLSIEQASVLVRGVGRRRGELEYDLPTKPLLIDITYPLTVGVRLCVHPYTLTQEFGDGLKLPVRCMDVGYFLLVVAQEYKRIYDHWRRYRVWGHELDDLYFTRLTFPKAGKGKAAGRNVCIEVTS